jgi:CheY-like chemotaxis protein
MSLIKILAVDDQEFNLDLIELTFMESPDVEIMRATNGQEALNVLEKDSDYQVGTFS